MVDQRTVFQKIRHLLSVKRGNKKHLALFIALFITPLILVGGYSIKTELEHVNDEIFSQSKSVAQFAALHIDEHLNHIVDLSVSLATRPLVLRGVEKGQWNEAEAIIHNAPNVFPDIDSIAILDTEGTLRAIVPPSPEIMGKSFAQRDYYQAVSKNWKPYVSPVFRKTGGNQDRIIVVAVPIRSSDNSRVTGFLVAGIRLEIINEWSKDFVVGAGDIAYIVDQKGSPVVWDEGVVEHTDDVFRRLLSPRAVHESAGAEVVVDTVSQESFLMAHAPIARYSWGVVLLRPTAIAFAERSNEAVRLVLPWSLALIFITVLFYFTLRNREVLRTERDREKLFLDSIGDGVVAIDRAWNITLWNRAASTISGWSREEALGKPLRSVIKFFKESEREEYFAFIEDAIVSGNVHSINKGVVLVRKDGKEIAIGDSAASIVNSEGQSEGAIIVFRDASKEREAERMRSDFAYAAHQLRTPVTEALWNIEIAEKQHDTKNRNESLEIAHDAILSVKDLEEHLLTISEIDRGVVVLRTSPVNLGIIFDEIKKDLLSRSKFHKVALSVDSSLMPAEINTDPKLLRVALLEVIENAIAYNHEGSVVTVRVAPQDGNLIFEIEDYGIGISNEDQPIIFTKFFRGNNRDKKIAGSGLGLFIAKEYVKVLDGKIWFKSRESKGTTFFISIPIR